MSGLLRGVVWLVFVTAPWPTSGGVSDFDLEAKPLEGAALDEARREVEFTFAGLRASRERLQRGHYELSERRIEKNADQETVTQIAYKIAFDDDQASLRTELEQTEPLPHPFRFTYIETPSEAFFWNHSGIFNIMRPGYLEQHAYPEIDVRAIGLGGYFAYIMRAGGLDTSLETFQTFLMEKALLVSVRHRDDGLLAVDYFADSDRLTRFKYLFDESKGFVPIHIDGIVYDRNTREWKDQETTDTTWVQVGDLWLPETMTATFETPEPKRRLELQFRWLSANEPLDENLFKRESIKLPPGTQIVDNTLTPDRATLVEIVGEPSGDEVIQGLPASGLTTGRLVLIGVNVVAVLAVVGALIYRVRRRGSPTSR